MGRSRGSLGTKIRAATDALGNPVRLLFGPAQGTTWPRLMGWSRDLTLMR